MATYNANISVKVAGLSQLKNLENRVQQLQDRFTKLNASAARITAPFQGHIKALTEINKLLRENNNLLNQQSRIANSVSRGSGGGGGSKSDAKVQAEVTEQLNRQIRLLRDRARQIDASGSAMQKLLRAEVEINAQVGGNVRLGKQLIKNARELITAEEQRGKAAETAAARELKAKQEIWKLQAKALQDQERAEARMFDARARNAAKAARDAERASGSTGRGGGALRTAGRVGGVVDRAFGGAFGAVGRAAEGAAVRGMGVAGALGGAAALNTLTMGHMGNSAIAGMIKQLAQMPGMLGAAAVAAAAFAPLLPRIAQGAWEAGQALGKLNASKPLKDFLSQGGQSFMSSAVNPLSAMNMKLPAGPGVQSPGAASAAAFGSNMGLNLVKQAADQMLVAIQQAADKQEKARQTAQGWADALKQGQQWIREATARIREFEGAQSEAARKRLAASTRTVGSSMTVMAQEAGRQQYAYNRELYPGGNTMTAQPQYRQQLNNAAITEASKTLQIRYNWVQALKQGAQIQKDITRSVGEETRATNAAKKAAMEKYLLKKRELATEEKIQQVLKRNEARQENKDNFQQKTESVMLGVGFPMMFGAGPGSIGGSLIGSFVGSGFGGQIFGGAIGQMVDQFAAAAMETGKSLRYPVESFEKLKEAGLFASRTQEEYIARLLEVGRVTEALNAINAELVNKIGNRGVQDLTAAGQAADELNKVMAQLGLQMQAFVAGPLAAFLKAIAGSLDFVATANSAKALAQDLRDQGKGGVADQLMKEALTTQDRRDTAKLREIIQKYEGQRKVQTSGKLTGEQKQQEADAALDAAERAEALRRQGIQLERQTQDLELQIADQVYGFRQRAADLERANIDLRRSVEDEIFRKRQDIARIEADNARAQAQLAIERLDMQLAGGRVGGNVPGQDIANQLLEGVRQYVKARAEGEADLQQKERMHVIEMEDLKRSAERFRFDVARKVDDLNRQGAELARDVERAKLTTARAIYDLQVQAADYQIAKAKEAIALMSDPAARLSATGALSNGVGGKVVTHLHGDPGRMGYDPAGHGGEANAHDHYRFDSPETARRVAAELSKLGYTITELKGVTSVGSHSANGGHYDGTAFDVPWAQFGSGAIGQRDYEKSRQLQAAIQRILGQGGGSVAAVPSAAAPALPASVGQAGSALNGVKIPGAADVSGLMASMSALDQKLLSAKTNALELAKAFAQLNKEQAAMALSNSVGAIVDQLNAPLDQLLREQENAAAFQREYAGLIAEGVTPALAEQVARIREQVRLQLEQLDTAVLQLEATKTKLEAEGKWTEELQKQLDLLKAQKGIIEGKGAQAEGGATQQQSPRQRLQDAYTDAKAKLTELTDPVNVLVNSANSIGSAFGQAFKDVASGSKSAQQALSDMFSNIAASFLDMAAQIIAQQLVLSILGIGMSALGGGAAPRGTPGAKAPNGMPYFGPAFASGGSTPTNTPVLVGERGPELFVPGQSGGITNNQNLRSMMNSDRTTSQEGGSGVSLNMSFQTTKFMDREWVDREQLDAAMARAAKTEPSAATSARSTNSVNRPRPVAASASKP